MKIREVYHELNRQDIRTLDMVRETGLDNWYTKLKKGIMDGEFPENDLAFEKGFDSLAISNLPDYLKDKGFGRLSSVFAWPSKIGTNLRVIELIVDSEKCIVCPFDAYTEAYGKGRSLIGESFAGWYWFQAKLLEDFLNKYKLVKPRDNMGDVIWEAKEGGSFYKNPEVLCAPDSILAINNLELN